MSIIGIGHDQVELERIRQSYERFGERFLRRCYTEEEIRFCLRRKDPIPGLAARFSAKEAGAKALGTGIARGVAWTEIEVRRTPGHRPTLHFYGRAAERAAHLGAQRAHVSLTHAQELASAFVILEGREVDLDL